jgi:acetylornithine/succinyldiaminopimelate/putrescine aminotransferase
MDPDAVKPEQLMTAFFRHVAQTSSSPMGIVVENAEGCTIRGTNGKEYLDLLAGIGVAALGHGHPRILAAIRAQAERHLHVMVYGELVQESQVELATRLSELLPAPLDSVYFTNSGAEAIEGALKLARKATGRTRQLAFEGGFHGDTFGALSLGGNPLYRTPFEPLLAGTAFLRFNDRSSLDAIDETVAAVVVEPVQAEAGVIVPEPGFLAELGARCSRAGALLVFDEVITGLGRTGTLFALEREGVVPDVLVLAKALGGGLPLGAFVAARALMRTLSHDPPLAHVTTFGGHPLSCAAGLAALDTIVGEGLPARAETCGARFAQRIAEALPPERLREVRRAGLLLGLRMDDAGFVARFSAECRREGLIVGWTLHDDTVVRLAPPLVISDAEIEEAAGRMERAASRATSTRGQAPG